MKPKVEQRHRAAAVEYILTDNRELQRLKNEEQANCFDVLDQEYDGFASSDEADIAAAYTIGYATGEANGARLEAKVADPTLTRMAERLRTQDNRATADPLFIVQEEERIWGLDPSWLDDDSYYIWHDVEDPEYSYESDAELLDEVRKDDSSIEELELPHYDDKMELGGRTYRRIYYAVRFKFVCAHFTEAAAQTYIDENGHRLKNPRVYVTSQYRCDEWNAVRQMLLKVGEQT